MDQEERKQNRVIGMIAHTELASTDPVATRNFLDHVFGWHFESLETRQGALISYQTQGGSQGSIRKTNPNEPPISMNYVLVENLGS